MPGDPRTTALLRQLHRASPAFREIWRRKDAHGTSAELKTFHHPAVGELTVRMQASDVRAAGSAAERLLCRTGIPSA